MRTGSVPAVFAVLLALAVPALAEAAVVPLAQERVLTALATASNTDEFDTNSDHLVFTEPGTFNESLQFDAAVTGAEADGRATINSSIAGPTFFAAATFAATASIDDDAFAESLGRGLVTYDFRLTEATPYTLSVQLQMIGSGATVFQLNGPDGNIFSFAPSDENGFFFGDQGVLEPGDYDVFVSTSGFGQAHAVSTTSASGFYYVVLQLDATVAVPEAPAHAELRVVPNPMRHAATIRLPGAAGARELTVSVHTADGRAVRTLRGAPGGTAVWDARDARGARVPPGVYFLRVEGGASSRVTLLR